MFQKRGSDVGEWNKGILGGGRGKGIALNRLIISKGFHAETKGRTEVGKEN